MDNQTPNRQFNEMKLQPINLQKKYKACLTLHSANPIKMSWNLMFKLSDMGNQVELATGFLGRFYTEKMRPK